MDTYDPRQYLTLDDADLAERMDSRTALRIVLSADDELVSDARLGKLVRRLLGEGDRFSAPIRERAEPTEPENVVDLMGWLQRGAERAT